MPVRNLESGDAVFEPMPRQIARLPRDKHGYPVPWFVAWVDGLPDFRQVPVGRTDKAVAESRCWICGGRRPRGAMGAFVIGPMCSINRVAPEPPSHPECAIYSATHCPFLITPTMVRRARGMDYRNPVAGGLALQRNPGVALVWETRHWRLEQVDGGPLWLLGDPEQVHWYAYGRAATRAEVDESIRTGLPALQRLATQDGPTALAMLEQQIADAQPLLPTPVPGE